MMGGLKFNKRVCMRVALMCSFASSVEWDIFVFASRLQIDSNFAAVYYFG